MSSRRYRSDLSKRIRAFMEASGTAWRSIGDITVAVDPEARGTIAKTIRNFIKRGELEQRYEKCGSPCRERLQVRYLAPLPKRRPRKIKARVLKAAYVSESFTSRDLARLSGVEIGYVCRVLRDLASAGAISRIGRKTGQSSNLTIWHINDRDKFRVEVMR